MTTADSPPQSRNFRALLIAGTILCLGIIWFNRGGGTWILETVNRPSSFASFARRGIFKVNSSFSAYRQCLLNGIFEAGRSQFFYKFDGVVHKCDEKTNIAKRLNFTAFPNNDETKYMRLPLVLQPDEECNIVTLGIGTDVQSETLMRKVLPSNCRFVGADPVEERNKALFSKLGTYFKMAVAAKDGRLNASLLGYNRSWEYRSHEIQHVSLLTLLKKHARIAVVDNLLIDNEGAEYDMLPVFLPGGQLERNEIILCQWNSEFHETSKDSDKQKFADFMLKNLVSGKYLPFCTLKARNNRAAFVNVEDDLCVRRYLPDFH